MSIKNFCKLVKFRFWYPQTAFDGVLLCYFWFIVGLVPAILGFAIAKEFGMILGGALGAAIVYKAMAQYGYPQFWLPPRPEVKPLEKDSLEILLANTRVTLEPHVHTKEVGNGN